MPLGAISGSLFIFSFDLEESSKMDQLRIGQLRAKPTDGHAQFAG
tara:strand:+ start:352 stop:486 length:135 start_codon:yes stop_codon:yes gene_type:complete